MTAEKRPVISPVTVTQETSIAVLGIPGRRFRESVHRLGVPHRHVGKLLVVLVADYLRAIGLDGDRREGDDGADEVAPDTEPKPAGNRVLRLLGREVAR